MRNPLKKKILATDLFNRCLICAKYNTDCPYGSINSHNVRCLDFTRESSIKQCKEHKWIQGYGTRRVCQNCGKVEAY